MTWEDVLLEHNRRPRGRGSLGSPTHRAHQRNPLCGDEVTVEIACDASGIIQEAAFQSQSCAICTAAVLAGMLGCVFLIRSTISWQAYLGGNADKLFAASLITAMLLASLALQLPLFRELRKKPTQASA